MTTKEEQLLSEVYPPFSDKLVELKSRCHKQGAKVKLIHGLRSMQEQTRLYNQGRSNNLPIVTKARAGSSWHNFGLGADWAFEGDMPFPNPARKEGIRLWNILGRNARDLRLNWGGDWGWDFGHVEMTCGVKLFLIQKMHREAGKRGMYGVWDELDKRAKRNSLNGSAKSV